MHIDVCESFNVHACGGYIYIYMSSPLLMMILGMVMFTLCIGNLMHWIKLRNLRQNQKNNYIKHDFKTLNLFKVECTCQVSLIIS